MGMRFGTWNVRSLYRAGTLKTVASELTVFWLENLKEKDHLEYLGIDGKIILGCILGKWLQRCELDSSGSR
jgi:hypothetical protein